MKTTQFFNNCYAAEQKMFPTGQLVLFDNKFSFLATRGKRCATQMFALGSDNRGLHQVFNFSKTNGSKQNLSNSLRGRTHP